MVTERERDGTSFSKFTLARPARAPELLKHPHFASRTIGPIAFDCGLSDLPYFNRTFFARTYCRLAATNAAVHAFEETLMRFPFVIAAAGFVIANGAGAIAGELPSFEAKSFPISPVQVQLLGAANVEEQSPAPTLTLADMPASPVQIAVLTPHRKQFADASKQR